MQGACWWQFRGGCTACRPGPTTWLPARVPRSASASASGCSRASSTPCRGWRGARGAHTSGRRAQAAWSAAGPARPAQSPATRVHARGAMAAAQAWCTLACGAPQSTGARRSRARCRRRARPRGRQPCRCRARPPCCIRPRGSSRARACCFAVCRWRCSRPVPGCGASERRALHAAASAAGGKRRRAAASCSYRQPSCVQSVFSLPLTIPGRYTRCLRSAAGKARGVLEKQGHRIANHT